MTRYFLLALPLLFLGIFNGYPLGCTIVASFTNWNGLSQYDFVGTQNYLTILRTNLFWYLLKNTLVILLYVPTSMFVSFVISCAVIGHQNLKNIFMYIIYIPQILSTVIVSKTFLTLFGYDGYVNALLRLLGFGAFDFFGNEHSALIITVLSIIWFEIGWQFLVILSALSNLDSSIHDLIRLDGLDFWQASFCIYLPMIYKTYTYIGFVSLFFAFSGLFPIIHILTKGGPGYATTTIDYLIFIKAFGTDSKLGEASALALLLLGLAIMTCVLYLLLMCIGMKFLRRLNHV